MTYNELQDGSTGDQPLGNNTVEEGNPTPQDSANPHGAEPVQQSGSSNLNTPEGEGEGGVDAPGPGESPQPKEDENYDRLRQKAAALESRMNNLSQFIASDETRYREALIHGGKSEREADAIIQDIKEKHPDVWKREEQPNAGQKPEVDQSQQNVNIDEIVQKAREAAIESVQTTEQKKIQQAAVDKYLKLYPEMDPAGKSYEEKQKSEQLAYAVDDQATVLMKYQGLSYEQALIKAHSIVTGEPERTPQDLESASNYNNNVAKVGTFAAPKASQSSGSSASSGLTDNELEYAKLAGMTPEEYAANKVY